MPTPAALRLWCSAVGLPAATLGTNSATGGDEAQLTFDQRSSSSTRAD